MVNTGLIYTSFDDERFKKATIILAKIFEATTLSEENIPMIWNTFNRGGIIFVTHYSIKIAAQAAGVEVTNEFTNALIVYAKKANGIYTD